MTSYALGIDIAGTFTDLVVVGAHGEVSVHKLPPWRVYGIRERVDYRGSVLAPLAEDDVLAAGEALAVEGVEAVCFLWSKHAAHERVRANNDDARERVPRAAHRALRKRARERLAREGSTAPLVLLDSSGGVLAADDAAEHPCGSFSPGRRAGAPPRSSSSSGSGTGM